MKTTSLCFILLSLYTSSSLCSAAEQPPPVRDMAGKEVRAGVDYYIRSVIRGAGGGGLKLGSVGNEACPLVVVQEGLDLFPGLPAYFRPVNPKKGVVRESTDLNVIFNASSICVQSTQWQLAFDESINTYFVGTGGEEGNPGSETISNWFNIQPLDTINNWYKFVYCPGVCDTCRPVCGDLSILVQDSTRRLVLSLNSDERRPFMVQFQRASGLDVNNDEEGHIQKYMGM
ncbi:hypothetical protein ACS0TY_012556 [Phlomoides rotata]